MIRPAPSRPTIARYRIAILVLALLSLFAAASPASAVLCSDFGGVLDGNVVPNPPFTQVQIDQDCTIRNYPASNPLTINFSFFSNPQGTPVSFLVIFDNVVHTGNMSCNNNDTQDHKIWFTNGSSSKIKQNCQDLLIPVEKIDKQNPAGTTTAAIGVPFTYTLTIPVLFDPATGSVINSSGSVNDLHSLVITDDLNDTLVDLSYVSHVAYWESSGLPVVHNFSNVGGLLTFTDINPPTFIVPNGEQIIIEITVVLENNQPPNTPGTLFHNTAKWEFGRFIDGVFYEPLPGEWGISDDLMIAAPDLVVTKSGPATLGLTLNLGQVGSFTIDVHNTGFTDAHDITIVDQLPDGPTGGMCDLTPTITSAQVFEADGTTPVSAPLVQGTDYSFAYSGAPTCEMTLVMLTPATVVGPDQRLIITYETKLDPDTQDGAVLTNVVGATEWFNGDDTNPDRVAFQRTLSDGTPGTPDHEDAHTVTAALYGFFFEKSVANVTTGVDPAAAAAPGDVLRYTLRLQATDVPLDGLTFHDDFSLMNPSAVFAPGSLTLVSVPPGADTSGTNANGGPNQEGILDVANLSVPVDGEIEVVFELTLLGGLADGTVVTNQADLLDLALSKIADSDDPNVNGQADPDIAGDEDPTVIVVSSAPVGPLVKSNTQATAAIGETFSYEITVPATPFPFPIYDLVITDDLSTSAADLEFVSVSKVSGALPWNPINTGTSTNLVIEGDTPDGIDLLANEQITIEITVRLLDTPTNVAPLPFTNTATYSYSRVDDGSRLPGDPDTSEPMTVVEPVLTMTKSGPATMRLGTPEIFSLDVQNTGDGPAWNATLTDLLPDGPTGGTCDTAPSTITAQVFESDGTTAASPVLVQGTDYSVSWSGTPGCLLTLSMLSAQATIDPGQRLIVTYLAELDAGTQNGATLTNIAGAVEWFSWDDTSPERRTYTEVVTDGTPGTLDHEDAHTVTVALPDFLFEKTVANLTSGANPAATAEPGDVLRYSLRLDNQSDIPLDDLAFVDDLGSLNSPAVFEPGTLTLVTVPPGADVSLTDPNGGTNGTGLVDVRNLDLPGIGQILIEFEVTLASPLADGTLVTNQTQLLQNGVPYALSDDPNVNGPADPYVDGDEDPTVLAIQLPAAGPLLKTNTQATAFPGETFSWEITVPETPYDFDIYDVQITDDLSASAADLTFVSVSKVSPGGTWTPDNTGTATNLVIEDTTDGIDIPAGTQITIAITVRLDDSPTNVAPLPFTNTADWTYYTVEGDPNFQFTGGSDESDPPMTVVEPDLTMTKSGPLSMSIGTPETFTLDVQNTGDSPAWMPTVTDLLPDGANGGTCDTPPANVTAQVFEADGTTPVSGVLTQGVDYDLTWTGPSACLLTLAFTTDQSTIGVGQRLIITYEAELDVGTLNGITLTNIAGAVEWFSDDVQPDRRTYSEVVTDGTPTIVDHEDSHTVGISLAAYVFEKTVANVDTGANPATTAEPGHTLRYTLRLENTTDIPLVDLAFVDDLGSLNSPAVFEPGTLTLVTVPPGADVSLTDPNGGTNGTGLVDVRNLDLPGIGQILIEFEVTLQTPLADGTLVTNQTELLSGGTPYAESDDPNVNGPANPFVAGDEDPTVVQIVLPPAGPPLKESLQSTVSVGETFSYQITVPETPFPYDIYDVQILDDLAASGANLRFDAVTLISPPGAWSLSNSGTLTDLIIEDTVSGIDIPANEQVVIEISVVVEDTPTNVSPLAFVNSADWTYYTIEGDPTSQQTGGADDADPVTIVEPDLTLTKDGPATMALGVPATFTLDVQNTGDGPAYNPTLTDLLPDTASGGTCDTAPTNFSAQVFESDGTTPVSGVLALGSDYTASFDPAPACLLTLVFLSDQSIEAGQRLIVTYDVELDSDTQDGVALTNIAGAIEWFSWDDTSPDRRTYTEVVTDGTPAVADHEDPHTVNAALPDLLFEKTVANVTSGADPATTATPGDVLLYTLRIENVGATGILDFTIQDDLGSLNASTVFQTGSLSVVSVPPGADSSGTDPLGGTNGAGLLEVTGLSLPGNGDSVTIEFQITLEPVIPNGTVVANQSQLLVNGTPFLPSDDPNVNGPADPDVAGDEDPTELVIASAPSFVIEKISDDITGDPTLLLAGETLRYTITVENVGTADATEVTLRDPIPANTTYVPDSTTLNGSPVADVGGTSPLVAGMFIHPVPGSFPAGSVATIVFEVVVDANAADGTIISNQGFVTSVPDGIFDDPSDDPGTPTVDDPTRDVVGAFPLLFAAKDAVLLDDFDNPNIVDPGDSLLYTITVVNSGSVPATNAFLVDMVPAGTSYRLGSTTLNTEPVPDGGSFPLDPGLPISSDDLTPPLPGPGGGTISPGGVVTVTFVLEVDLTTTPGTIISNQATVTTDDTPNLLTDGDGDPSTGPEPTIVVVGDGQELTISKQVSVVGGGPVLAGSTLEYLVQVTNVSSVDALDVVITDDLSGVADLTYVGGSATMNGSTNGVSDAGSVIIADYGATYGALAAGGVVVLRFQAVVNPLAVIGTTITNTAEVSWNANTQNEMATVSVDVGGTPGFGILNGSVWHDANFDDVKDPTERSLAGWSVDLYRNGSLADSTTTDANGDWSMGGLATNDLSGDQYEIRFTAPGAGSGTAKLGLASSPFTNDLHEIRDIVIASGDNLQDLDLPIDPNGVVYDAILRAPVSGAGLTLLSASGGTPVNSDCFDDPAQQGQITGPDGYYKFDLNFDDLSCPEDAGYLIAVAPPGAGYSVGASQIIPPTTDATTAPLLVPSCPGGVNDALGAPAGYCEAQASEFAPPATTPPGPATAYFLHLSFNEGNPPATSQIFNNHIALDPVLNGAVGISKTTPSQNVSRGQLVPYQIVVSNALGAPILDLGIVDTIPPGFRYIDGSARIDGVPNEPVQNGRELRWDNVGIDALSSRTLVMLLAVGAGVSDGEYVNRVQAVSSASGVPLSGEAIATVRVVPDPTFSCTDVMGKVFDDKNRNGAQDPGELGLGGVRIVTPRGLAATTDANGRYHFTCAALPNDFRGNNLILKLDDRTLPSGYRMSGPLTQVKRATAGKALRFNFGASIHRVVSLDLADPVFEPGSARMRQHWEPRIGLLLDELGKSPSVLRLSYVADVEGEGLVEERLEAMKRRISEAWEARGASYPLTIEPEVYWRRGAPVEGRRPDREAR